MNIKEVNGVKFVYSKLLENTGMVRHGFSTRIGGNSSEVYESMNLSYKLGDEKEKVDKNYEDFCEAVGIKVNSLVSHNQVHTDTVIRVDDSKDFEIIQDFDGMVSNKYGVSLCIYSADCAAVFFLDPKKRAIGMCHSGWKGTLRNIVAKTLKKMNYEYGCEYKDIICFVAPTICGECFEVGEEVYEIFVKEEFFRKEFSKKKENAKYLIDLKATIKEQLLKLRVLEDNIEISDVCTMCREDLFFSHRRCGLARGSHLGVLTLLKSDKPS